MRVLNVTQLTEENLEKKLPLLLDRQGALGSRDFTFLCRVYPEQEPILQGLQNHLRAFAAARDFFRKKGIRTGVLIQTLLGHGERCEWPSPVSFQRFIGIDGVETRAIYCPLDEDFIKFACDGVRLIAGEKPDWILVDDDFRMDAHWPGGLGCFCPQHLARFEEMFGVRLTLPELRKWFAEDTKEGRVLRQQWLQLEAEGLWQLLRRMRAEIDAVAPEISGGVCTTSSQALLNETSCRIFAGQGRPLLRVGGAVYLDRDSKKLPITLDSLVRQKRMVPSDFEVLCESDTYPHHRYSLSAQKLRAYLKTCLLLGFDGAKAWVQHTYGFIPNENPRFFQAYSEVQKFSEQIESWVKQVKWKGIACPTSPTDLAYFPWTDTGGKTHQLSLWTEAVGRMGIPWVPGANAGDILAFEGSKVDAFSDSAWETMLRGNVWLDGPAAWVLQRRDLGHLLGIQLEEKSNFYTSAEHFLNLPQWNGASANRMNMAARREPTSVFHMEPLSSKTTELSSYIRWPAWGKPEQHERVGASVTVFENSVGGKVMVYAGCLPATYDLQVVHPFRREQWLGITRWMAEGAFPIEVVSESDLMIFQGSHTKQGELLFLLNLNLDQEQEIVLRRQPFSQCQVEKLDAVAGWVPVKSETRQAGLVIDLRLPYLEAVLLRFVPGEPSENEQKN